MRCFLQEMTLFITVTHIYICPDSYKYFWIGKTISVYTWRHFFKNNVFSRYGLPRVAYLFTVSGEDFHGNCKIGFCAKHSIWCLWCDSFCHRMYFIKVPGVNWTAVYFTVFLTSLNTSSFYYFIFLQCLCGINKPVTSMQNVKRA